MNVVPLFLYDIIRSDITYECYARAQTYQDKKNKKQTKYQSYSIPFVFKRSIKENCKFIHAAFYKQHNKLKCVTTHDELVPFGGMDLMYRMMVKNEYNNWHKDIIIIFWYKNNHKMIVKHYLTYTGTYTEDEFSDARIKISPNGQYIAIEYHNTLNIINRNNIIKNKIRKIDHFSDQTSTIQLIDDQSPYIMMSRWFMKYFNNSLLSENQLLSVITNINNGYLLFIIDCKTTKKIHTQIIQKPQQYMLLNNNEVLIPFIQRNIFINGKNATRIENLKLNIGDVKTECFIQSFVRSNINKSLFQSSFNSKYLLQITNTINESAIIEALDMDTHEILEILEIFHMNQSDQLKLVWLSEYVVIIMKQTRTRYHSSDQLYVISNAVYNNRKKKWLQNLMNDCFHLNACNAVLHVVLEFIGFETIVVCEIEDMLNEEAVEIEAFCDENEDIYCLYGGCNKNMKLMKLVLGY
eukprot:296000_1